MNDSCTPESNDTLKTLHAKVMTISGYIIAMRSDHLNEQRKNEADLKKLLQSVKSIKRNLEIYFIIILFLVFIIFQKFIWNSSITTF